MTLRALSFAALLGLAAFAPAAQAQTVTRVITTTTDYGYAQPVYAPPPVYYAPAPVYYAPRYYRHSYYRPYDYAPAPAIFSLNLGFEGGRGYGHGGHHR